MVSGKYSALAGAVSREQSLANIANNLANVSTAGYKKMLVSFESILNNEQQMGAAKGINYDRVKQTATDFSPGPLQNTGNVFDLAISKNGFFKVLGPEGTLYTRNGSFELDQNGTLRTKEGFPVLNDGDTPIEIAGSESSRISIDRYGAVSTIDNLGNSEEIGRIAVVDINDTTRLKHHSNTNFSLDQGGAEIPLVEPYVVPGSIELSNVNMVDEMTRMINGHRLYETYHKVLKGYSSISEKQDELGTLA